MTLLFCGQHPTEFNNTGVVAPANTVNDSFSDPGYNVFAAGGVGMLTGDAIVPIPLGNLSEVWAGFTMGNVTGSASENSTRTMLQISTSGGVGIVRLQNTTGPVRTFQYWNGSAWVNIGTLTNSGTLSGVRIDIHCKIHGSAGEFSIYVNRILQHSLTGNTDFFGATIDRCYSSNWGQFNGRHLFDFLVATTDTRRIRVKSGYFTGNSATNTGWTGGFANLDELIQSNYTAADADASVSSAGGQAMSFTKEALGLLGDDGDIIGVSVSARANNDGSSADFDLLCRSGGTNYTKSHQRTINTTITNGYYALWTTDPNGNIPWTHAAVDAAELGMVSKNAGVSSIYLMSYSVAIHDTFYEPWESGYPTTTENVAMEEVTAPASVGYVDVTIPDMIADNCSPQAILVLTTGGSSGAAQATARQSFGFARNNWQASFQGKGSIGYQALDASAASSTLRFTQNRRLRDFASSNGGWLIDASGLRVRFQKFIKGGVRLYYETTNSGRQFSVMFFWGANLQVELWMTNLGTVTTAQAQTGIGFKPDAGIFFSAGSTVGNVNPAYYSIGMAADDGGGLLQRTLMRYSATSVAAGPQPVSMIDDTAIGGLQSATGTVSWDLTLNSFDTDGFTVQASASAGSATLYSLLFKRSDGKKFKIVDYTTPTSNGAQAVTGAGFYPQTALGVSTALQAVNAASVDAEPASSVGFFAIAPDGTTVSINISEQSNSDPSEANSYMDVANPIRIGTDNATLNAVVADFSGWASDGLTLNYTTTAATAKHGFMLLFEGTAPPPPADSTATGLIFVVM